jgi:thiosulfate dehydrogenase (quinone) large subunit
MAADRGAPCRRHRRWAVEGFLANAAYGPFAGLYASIAGAAWADWLFMLGLLGLGVALILGIGLWVAAVAGGLLMVMMWSAQLLPDTNPVLTYHLIYALMMVGFALSEGGETWGLGRRWAQVRLVERFPVLR